MPRRIYTYDDSLGLNVPNMLSTIGAFIIAISTLIFIGNMIYSRRQRVVAPADPWDGRTLEWTIPSPPPVYNFAEVPTVHDVDDFWHKKYTEDENGRLVRLATADAATEPTASDDEGHGIHLPSPSFYPLVASAAFPVIAYGIIYKAYPVSIVGGLILLAGLYGWALEPSAEPEDHSGDGIEAEHAVEDRELVGASVTPALASASASEPVVADGGDAPEGAEAAGEEAS
jgi:cytochrome c oxidase subunit I